jgi:hypothetical protein
MPPRKPRQSKKNVVQEDKPSQATLVKFASEVDEEVVKQPTQAFFNTYDVASLTTTKLKEDQQIVQEEQINTVVEEEKLVNEVNKSIELQRDYTVPDNVISNASQQLNPTQFYLYHILEKQAIQTMGSRTRLELKELESFNKHIKLLDVEGMRICFVIIRMHAIKQKSGKIFDLPYNGKIIKEYQSLFDIEFDLKDLPGILQKMLLIFAERHLENTNITDMRQDEDTFVRKKF